ncbi:transmembrane protein, putative (macronuclear) [Tetrahymena thermophila SB210]|uniref:Transmembrane protein, putative n=1 Tax=Tetrahymena thermophila (strain SB210) TaxID=312017 RepID=I7LZL1_TETTS|nr:transmembrane protein, putative [Tetrahymena thermophila SB210]EAR84136.1 transmembrane protein, putative [Tetrahymena thermophila SB210]|eukprot:XP_001031799.1 transmembrane protein, putative [Tetrahymena thermophila SB210]
MSTFNQPMQFVQSQYGGGGYYGNSYQASQPDRNFQQNSPVKNSQMVSAKPYEEEQFIPNEPQSRVTYLRKLYLAVFFQILVTTFFTHQAEYSVNYRSWVLNTTGFTFVFCLIVTIVLSLGAFLQKSQLSRPIVNYVSYILYTLAFGVLFSYFDAKYSSNFHHTFVVLAYLTFGLFLHALLCFGIITFQNASIFIIGSVLLVTLKMEIFTQIGMQTIYVLSTLAILFGYYVIWENETVISGAKTEWSREDPVVGSIAFFLNLFTLFLRLANMISKIAIVSYTRS